MLLTIRHTAGDVTLNKANYNKWNFFLVSKLRNKEHKPYFFKK